MKTEWLQRYIILSILLLMCIFLSIASPYFLTYRNIINIIRQVSINGILAAGMTFVIIGGGIDLSVGSIVGFVGAIAAGLQYLGTLPAILISLVMGILVGAINGILITKGNIPPFIATLGMLSMARGATLLYTGGQPIFNLNSNFRYFGAGNIGPIPVPIVMFILIAFGAHVFLKNTVYGREIYAIGGNLEAAKYSGVPTKKRVLMNFCIMGFLCAIAGIILTARLNSADPTAGTGMELDVIAAVIIGGTSLFGGEGTIFGTTIGVLIIGVLNNGLNLLQVSSYYQIVLKGAIVVGAVILDSALRNK